MIKLRMARSYLLLLPGMDGTGRLFDPLLRCLPSGIEPRVISYPRDKPQRYQDLMPLVREAIPWEEPYFVLAESFSGPLAVMFAVQQRRDIRGIILAASFVSNPHLTALKWIPPAAATVFFRKTPPRAILQKAMAGDDCPPPILESLELAIASVVPEVLSHRLQLIRDTDVTSELQCWDRPLLYLAGRKDHLIGRRGYDTIRRIKPATQLVELDAPHMLLQRCPQEAAAAIDRFIQANG